ncbi:hypothetical protein [Salinimicrobium sediminilitoris]|uniref:hypothetical protein n=1 Tax=Salinimicrobium sediminilitoris TaxID=2876715 RepID=UPI001E56C66A|nr:hypothetical protein [Salinimicrobium sediminilitoris]MCC8359855.1 hypothetical protein [Salinimicrobium sediminilitoris]
MSAIRHKKGLETRAEFNTIMEKFRYKKFYADILWLHSMRMMDKEEMAQLQADFSLKKLI